MSLLRGGLLVELAFGALFSRLYPGPNEKRVPRTCPNWFEEEEEVYYSASFVKLCQIHSRSAVLSLPFPFQPEPIPSVRSRTTPLRLRRAHRIPTGLSQREVSEGSEDLVY